ncbi:MAG: hypothetical protein ABFS17_03465 [Chloroflexota bacterium]
MKRLKLLHIIIVQAFIIASTIAAVQPAPKHAPPIPASPPGNVAASDGTFTDHVEVTWVGVPTANKYYIFRDSDPGGAGMVQVGSKSSHSYKDFAVTDMQVYYYWVQACNKTGCSEISASDSGYAQSAEVPASAPANLAASDGSFTDQVSLTWDAAADATEYQVFRDTDPGGAAMILISTTAGLSYNDAAIVDLQVYYYWVKACSISGCSPVSTPDSGFAEAITGGIIFWDDLETGDFSQWTRFNSGGGWLYPCTKAGINGTWGACVERGSNDRRKQLIDETPVDQTKFHVRFNFDMNSLSMGNDERFRFMQVKMGAERPFFIVVLNRGGFYEIQLNTLLDDLTKVKTGWYPLADRPVTIEVNWQAASADGANDGYAELYINDLLQEALTGLDNDTIIVDTFKIGFTSRLEGKLISGVFFVDDVSTSNGTHIGLP